MKTRLLDLPDLPPVRVLDAGQGPTVLMLHGNPDNADEWLPLIERLSPEYRCVAPDLPGYGRRGETRPLDGFAYTVDDQIRFVDALLGALELPRALTLVVHDIGGIMGVPWAAANVDRLTAMVYTNTVAFPGFEWFDVARQWGSTRTRGKLAARLTMWLLGRRGGRLFARAFGQQNPQLDRAALARFTEHFALNPIAKATTLEQFRRIVRRGYFDGYDAMLERVREAAPTVTVWGEGDPYVPDARAEDLRAAELRRLDGIGHWVPLLAADALAEAIREIAPAG